MLTSLSFMANIMALACSAAFPTIGSKITLIKATDMLIASEAPCWTIRQHSDYYFNTELDINKERKYRNVSDRKEKHSCIIRFQEEF